MYYANKPPCAQFQNYDRCTIWRRKISIFRGCRLVCEESPFCMASNLNKDGFISGSQNGSICVHPHRIMPCQALFYCLPTIRESQKNSNSTRIANFLNINFHCEKGRGKHIRGAIQRFLEHIAVLQLEFCIARTRQKK